MTRGRLPGRLTGAVARQSGGAAARRARPADPARAEAPVPWDIQADVVVVGFGGGRLRGAGGGVRRQRCGPARPVPRRRRHGPVRRGNLRGRRHALAVRRGRGGLGRGDVRLPEHRGRRRGVGGHVARVLRRQPGHGGLGGTARGAVRGESVPGQDLLPLQPALPVLLRQRAVRGGRGGARAARAPGPRPRHLGQRAVRPAGPAVPQVRRAGAVADHRTHADHR